MRGESVGTSDRAATAQRSSYPARAWYPAGRGLSI